MACARDPMACARGPFSCAIRGCVSREGPLADGEGRLAPRQRGCTLSGNLGWEMRRVGQETCQPGWDLQIVGWSMRRGRRGAPSSNRVNREARWRDAPGRLPRVGCRPVCAGGRLAHAEGRIGGAIQQARRWGSLFATDIRCDVTCRSFEATGRSSVGRCRSSAGVRHSADALTGTFRWQIRTVGWPALAGERHL